MSHASTSHPSSGNQPSTTSREANIDKFATLFTPGTPRASPDLGFTPLPEMRFSDAHRQASHRRVASDSSQQSDFGAFVTVSAFDDPLAADIIEDAGLQAPMAATPTTATPTTTTYPKDVQDTKPSSLSFFDQFAQDAKQRSTSRRSVVLEELLKHEDDPLYFLKEEISKPTTPIPPDTTPAPTTALSHDHDFDIHQELDPDYFRRSSSFHAPVPKLAPPLASVAGAIRSLEERTSPPPLDPDETLPGVVDDKNRRRSEDSDSIMSSRLAKSTSSQSLSDSLGSIPPRWMSTLLRGGHSPSSATAKPVLESIFGDHSSPSSSPTAHASLSHTHSRAASTPTQSRRTLPRSQTSPSPSSPTPVFTHTSAFAPPPASTSSMALSHGASPFASHAYIPPTGAPGFKGESYTWDKGFSEELETEREQERERGKANVMPQTVLDPSPVQTTREGEKEQAVPVAIRGRRSGGWGSGFGFGFGSMRGSGNGKGKQVADARDIVSPSGSNTLSAVRRASPGRSTGSGSSSSSRSRLEDEDLGGDHGRRLTNLSNPGSDHNSRGRQVGMGEFIEKITGDVKLLGRKAATTPVLTPELAGRVRLSIFSLFPSHTYQLPSIYRYDRTYPHSRDFQSPGRLSTLSIKTASLSIPFTIVVRRTRCKNQALEK